MACAWYAYKVWEIYYRYMSSHTTLSPSHCTLPPTLHSLTEPPVDARGRRLHSTLSTWTSRSCCFWLFACLSEEAGTSANTRCVQEPISRARSCIVGGYVKQREHVIATRQFKVSHCWHNLYLCENACIQSLTELRRYVWRRWKCYCIFVCLLFVGICYLLGACSCM